MTNFQKRKTTVVLKDSNGDLFQAMPETAAKHVSYGNSSLSDELDRQKNFDIAKVSQEIDTETETVAEQIHEENEGLMEPSEDITGNYYQMAFQFYLYNTDLDIGDHIWSSSGYSTIRLWDFYDEDGNNVGDYYSVTDGYIYRIPANKRYYYDFTLDANFTANTIYGRLLGASFYKNEEIDKECPGNTLLMLGSSYISNSPYITVNENEIPFEHPEIGSSTTIYFDAWQNDAYNDNWDGEYHEMEHLDKSITIERLSATNYRLSFYWETIRDVTVEKTITKKKLNTIVERVDGTSSSTSTQITGILQDVDINVSRRLETEISQIKSTYHPYVYIGGD